MYGGSSIYGIEPDWHLSYIQSAAVNDLQLRYAGYRLGSDPDKLSADILLFTGGNGNNQRCITRTGVFFCPHARNSYGCMRLPGGMGVFDFPAEPVYGKPDDFLPGIMGAGIAGQRGYAFCHLPPDADKSQSPAV